jgi:hypothetical protein
VRQRGDSGDCGEVVRSQNKCHPPPLTEVKPPEHAEVDEADPAAGQEQHVARVGVGVEEPELENLAEHGGGARAQRRVRIDPGLPQAGGGLGWQPVQEPGCQHAL